MNPCFRQRWLSRCGERSLDRSATVATPALPSFFFVYLFYSRAEHPTRLPSHDSLAVFLLYFLLKCLLFVFLFFISARRRHPQIRRGRQQGGEAPLSLLDMHDRSIMLQHRRVLSLVSSFLLLARPLFCPALCLNVPSVFAHRIFVGSDCLWCGVSLCPHTLEVGNQPSPLHDHQSSFLCATYTQKFAYTHIFVFVPLKYLYRTNPTIRFDFFVRQFSRLKRELPHRTPLLRRRRERRMAPSPRFMKLFHVKIASSSG